jgi:hypothetical protein
MPSVGSLKNLEHVPDLFPMKDRHNASADDRDFLRSFEAAAVAPSDFNHAAHVRLAYVYLCDHAVDESAERMKNALLTFLRHNGISEGKFHETLTRAWVMAVDHFMTRSQGADSASGFMSQNPQLLDSKIMLSHYSAEVLFSDSARASFVPPDVQPIPPP